jgi:hypothetical protein
VYNDASKLDGHQLRSRQLSLERLNRQISSQKLSRDANLKRTNSSFDSGRSEESNSCYGTRYNSKSSQCDVSRVRNRFFGLTKERFNKIPDTDLQNIKIKQKEFLKPLTRASSTPKKSTPQLTE